MIQIDMPMPKSCEDCRLFGYDEEYDWVWCAADEDAEYHDNDDTVSSILYKNCPLREVKTGDWENVRRIYCDESIARCSVCGAVVPVGDYCSNCGSRNEE